MNLGDQVLVLKNSNLSDRYFFNSCVEIVDMMKQENSMQPKVDPLSDPRSDYVAHIKFTVLLMPNGSDCIMSHPLQELQPTKTIDDPEIKA
ncbi:unnamed protein product [Camellia sinensis]